jgi:osmotically-inducible protein OsmY
MRDDQEVKRDVEEELRWSPYLDPSHIAVSVKDGVVTLTGFARSYVDRYEAERAAKRVAGVVGLANDIEVRIPSTDQRLDPEIARDVVASLKRRLPITWRHVKVTVREGWVTLEGRLRWNFQRERAARAAGRVRGVRGVTNLTELEPQVDAGEVRQKIEQALQRSAEIDAQRIRVETNDGEVVLEGTVRSWAERQEAERTAWSAPGVRKVENRIAIAV